MQMVLAGLTTTVFNGGAFQHKDFPFEIEIELVSDQPNFG